MQLFMKDWAIRLSLIFGVPGGVIIWTVEDQPIRETGYFLMIIGFGFYCWGLSLDNLFPKKKDLIKYLNDQIINQEAINNKTLETKCGNCKFWGNKEDNEQQSEYRECQAFYHDVNNINEPMIFKAYNEDEQDKIRERRKSLPIAVTVDGSGYYAAVKCKESFGCKYFEKRK